MRTKAHPVTYYTDKIERGEVFSFSRYGNGEFACMMKANAKYKNASGHHYFPELALELKLAIGVGVKQPGHFVGIQNMCLNGRSSIPEFVKKINYEWHCSDVFHHANYTGTVGPLFSVLRKKKVMVVGPDYISGLNKHIHLGGLIGIPIKDCWKRKKEVERLLLSEKLKGWVVVFVASLMTDVVIADLFPHIGKQTWMLNLGSMFDPYCGKITRSYHKRMSPDIMRKNLCG